MDTWNLADIITFLIVFITGLFVLVISYRIYPKYVNIMDYISKHYPDLHKKAQPDIFGVFEFQGTRFSNLKYVMGREPLCSDTEALVLYQKVKKEKWKLIYRLFFSLLFIGFVLFTKICLFKQ